VEARVAEAQLAAGAGDELLEARGMTLTALADQIGVTIVNLSVLKNQRARAIRFSTLTAICDALDCQPGDLFELG